VAALNACADLGVAIEQRQPKTAADWAAVYAAEMREMRRMLQVGTSTEMRVVFAWFCIGAPTPTLA
jgi:hypothetical protein